MALEPSAVGKPLGPFVKEYQWRDVVLYALGVGGGFSELEYCYEKNLKVIPTFSIAAVFDFFFHVAAAAGVNLRGMGSQGVALALDPSELESLDEASLKARYEEQRRAEMAASAPEDVSDIIEEQERKRKRMIRHIKRQDR